MTLLSSRFPLRRWRFIGFVILAGLSSGCPIRELPPPVESQPTAVQKRGDGELPAETADTSQRDDLRQWIADVLRANREHRRLSTDVNAAWQIMHGVLAYGRELQLATSSGNQPAVEYLLGGGAARGFDLRGGDWFELPRGSNEPPQQLRGIVAELQPGAKIGQGHRDQWLAYMARCGLAIDEVVVTRDGPLTIGGWIKQIQWDVPRNFEHEFSWTLTALVAYRPTTDRWTARDGRDYSIESLLESELRELGPSNACGGSHRLCAIATALSKHRRAGHPIIGVWADADRWVKLAIEQTREFQNADGSFSSNYFERPGWSADLVAALGTTGHAFEFLAVAGDDELLRQPWVEAAARFLCRTLEQTAELDLECGALYHALSGLSIYHERISREETL